MPGPLDYKPRGEWAELVFMQEARRRGLIVGKPFGDSAPYDIFVDSGRRLYRVQVKSVSSRVGKAYTLVAGNGRRKRPYTKAEIDFLAAYVIPKETWYIVPIEAITPRLFLRFFPGKGRGRLEPYREAWRLLGR